MKTPNDLRPALTTDENATITRAIRELETALVKDRKVLLSASDGETWSWRVLEQIVMQARAAGWAARAVNGAVEVEWPSQG